ncbi:MAG: putative sulfate/molybdate transporter [Candidatus Omnitrophica bacterium]|nr:putative sulfate/molybdate transporter [Candidatus Omnitrophota bacterium]
MNAIKRFFTNNKIRFDRNEFSGSLGDIGTDLPLIAGMVLACKLDSASVMIMFGLMQVLMGIIYGFPMPVQPLKAMAVIMISNKLSGNLLYGAGFAIGVIMLFLSLTGLLNLAAKAIPKSVIRGIQFGLGVSLAILALKDYVQSDAIVGYFFAFCSFILMLIFLNNKKYPPALFVMLVGMAYAFIFKINFTAIGNSIGFALPKVHSLSWQDIFLGFIVLALPQLPLSVANSVIATKQTINDLYPEKPNSIKKIGLTYSLMNLINPFFSGIPMCHGAGGLAGHYAFGGRTGGSVIIYGSFFLAIGLFFSKCFAEVIRVFPLPILGVILLFEALMLMLHIKDVAGNKKELFVSLLVGLMVICLPYGYVIGVITGTLIVYFINKGIMVKLIE